MNKLKGKADYRKRKRAWQEEGTVCTQVTYLSSRTELVTKERDQSPRMGFRMQPVLGQLWPCNVGDPKSLHLVNRVGTLFTARKLVNYAARLGKMPKGRVQQDFQVKPPVIHGAEDLKSYFPPSSSRPAATFLPRVVIRSEEGVPWIS